MGAALPHPPPPPPMQASVRGSKLEVSTDPSTEVAALVLRASRKARGVYFRQWMVTGSACQHPPYVMW